MNLKYFSEKNPDIDLNVRRIAFARVGALKIFHICYTDVNKEWPTDFLVESPPGELPTRECVVKETLSLFQRVYFGEPFPFYFFERCGFLLNLGALQCIIPNVSPASRFEAKRRNDHNTSSIELSFYGSEIDPERARRWTLFFRGLSEKEAFKEELLKAKREYHRTAPEFFANFPDEGID